MIVPERREDRWKKLKRVAGRYGKIEVLSVFVGLISGISAVALDAAISEFRDFLEYLESTFTLGPVDVGLLLAPAVGGLVSGIIVWRIAPEVKGHGIPSVLEAFLFRRGIIRLRVPVTRILASGALIGMGGSAGREGPIGQVGAGVGSAVAQLFKLPERARKILLMSGLSAGISAAFDTPLGGVLFGVEVITGAIYPLELIPIFLASISAVSLSWTLRGEEPIIKVPKMGIPTTAEVLALLALGSVVALVAKLWVDSLYWAEDSFNKVKLPTWVKPAIGGLGTGAIAFWSLGWGIMGPGFDGLNRIINDEVYLLFLLLLASMKIVATSLSIGSGGSGGIFTPTLFIGAAVGSAFGHLLNHLSPGTFPRPELFAVAGMAAHFSAAARAPLTAVVLTMELGRDYALIPSLLAACSTSYFLSLILMDYTMYTRELEEKGERVPIAGLEVLDHVKVEEIMARDVVTVSPEDTLDKVHDLIMKTHHQGFPVVEGKDLRGMIAFSDIMMVHRKLWPRVKVKDVMRKNVIKVSPDETAHSAALKMLRCDVGRLPVVKDGKLVGIVTRSDVLRAYSKAVHLKDSEEAAEL